MKAIETKFVGPSNVRGARIIVTDGDHRRVYSYDYGASDPHATAARAFALEMGWSGRWHEGGTRAGHVFVLDCLDHAFTISEEEAAPGLAKVLKSLRKVRS
jgi:hypothetical protein